MPVANIKRVYGGANGKIILFRPAEAHQKVLDTLIGKGLYKTKSEILRTALFEFGQKHGAIENTTAIDNAAMVNKKGRK